MTAPLLNSRLSQIVSRIERLESDKAAVAADLKEVYAEAKQSGFDTRIIRKCVKLRSVDPKKAQQEEEVLDLYMSELGTLPLPFS